MANSLTKDDIENIRACINLNSCTQPKRLTSSEKTLISNVYATLKQDIFETVERDIVWKARSVLMAVTKTVFNVIKENKIYGKHCSPKKIQKHEKMIEKLKNFI